MYEESTKVLNYQVQQIIQKYQINPLYKGIKSISSQDYSILNRQSITDYKNQFKMQNRSEIITTLQQKYQEYIQKIKLTDEAKTRTHQIKAQLSIIALIHSTTPNDNKKQIEKKLFEVQKVLDGRLRGQGWLSFLSKTNEVVSLDQVWRQISFFKNDPRENLIKDVCQLKKIIS